MSKKSKPLDVGQECVMSKLIMEGLPRKPAANSTKDDLWRDIGKLRRILYELRQSMLWIIVQQLRAGGPSIVSSDDLRELADQLDSESELDPWSK